MDNQEFLKSLDQDELINMVNKLRQEKDRKNEYYRKKYNESQEARLKRKEYYNKNKQLKSDILSTL